MDSGLRTKLEKYQRFIGRKLDASGPKSITVPS
jgi:hypothetical protein